MYRSGRAVLSTLDLERRDTRSNQRMTSKVFTATCAICYVHSVTIGGPE